MKATIEMPDDLYRRVKAKSALRGRAVREVAMSLFQGWVAEEDDAAASEPAAAEELPAWFGSARAYARRAGRHDMAAVGASIARRRVFRNNLRSSADPCCPTMPPVNNPLFRPPAEAESLILQVDQGCPHNRCTFCGMYRHMAYRRLSMGEVGALIQREARRHPGARRAFLADGDVMCRPFAELRDTLLLLNESFPHLARVGVYANGRSVAAKTADELCPLRRLRLHTLYMGLESGDEVILMRCRKGDTAGQMVQAGIAAQAAGLRMSVMILLGLGGRDRSAEHVQHTAEALNRMQPRLLSALRVIPIAGTELGGDAAAGQFGQLTEWQAVDELRNIIERLDLKSTVFRANHSSNVVPLEGRLPREKERLLAGLDLLLASNELDRDSPGPPPLWL